MARRATCTPARPGQGRRPAPPSIALLLDQPTSVRAAIAAALLRFDARVAPALGARGAELLAAVRHLAESLGHDSDLATQEALHALRRRMAALGDEFTDERTELGALTLAVDYLALLAPREARDDDPGR